MSADSAGLFEVPAQSIADLVSALRSWVRHNTINVGEPTFSGMLCINAADALAAADAEIDRLRAEAATTGAVIGYAVADVYGLQSRSWRDPADADLWLNGYLRIAAGSTVTGEPTNARVVVVSEMPQAATDA